MGWLSTTVSKSGDGNDIVSSGICGNNYNKQQQTELIKIITIITIKTGKQQ